MSAIAAPGENGAPAAATPAKEKAAPAAAAPAKPKPAKADAPKPEKADAPSAGTDAAENEANFAKAHLRVGKVLSVEPHPVAEKLWVCKIDVGGEERQVVAGLRNYYSAQELTGLLVCVIVNLKVAKLAGTPSEAMILAGSSGDNVKAIAPPAGSVPGDQLFLEGMAPSTEYPKQLSSKIWEKVVPGLTVQGGKAKYFGKQISTAKGDVTVPVIADGGGIH
eukprot:jgi/Mesvir1/29007/Mv17774-RA.1